MLAPSLGRLAPPPMGNPGSAPGRCSITVILVALHTSVPSMFDLQTFRA